MRWRCKRPAMLEATSPRLRRRGADGIHAIASIVFATTIRSGPFTNARSIDPRARSSRPRASGSHRSVEWSDLTAVGHHPGHACGTFLSVSEDPPHESELPESSDFGREWSEILNEIRVMLPGVQLLFGFLLTAPFTNAFRALSEIIRYGYFFCFLTTTASCAFLIAPSVYHRLHWRRDVRDKELMLRTCNRLAIIGVVFLDLAMTSAVYVVSRTIAGHLLSVIASVAAALLFTGLWFALPILRRNAERRR